MARRFGSRPVSPPPVAAPSPPAQDGWALVPAIETDESVDAYIERAAPFIANRAVMAVAAGDMRMAKALLDLTSAAKDRYSAPMEIHPDQLATPEGVGDVMRRIGAAALSGKTGLSEAVKACELTRTVADAMFTTEIGSLKAAIEQAKQNRLAPIMASVISRETGGALSTEEASKQITGGVKWGRMASMPTTIDAEVTSCD